MTDENTNQAAPEFNIETLIDNTERTVWAEFKNGFELEICHISKSELQKLAKRCTSLKFDAGSRGRTPQLDPDKFVPEFVRRVVRGWRGLTPTVLATLLPISIDKIPEERRKEPIKFSHAQMAVIMKNCYDVDVFLNEIATDLGSFRPDDFTEETKN